MEISYREKSKGQIPKSKNSRPLGFLDQRVDERRQDRILREDQEDPEEDDHEEDRHQPPLLADAHEGPEICEDGEFGHLC